MRFVGCREDYAVCAWSAAPEGPEEVGIGLGIGFEDGAGCCEDGELQGIVNSPALQRGQGSMAASSWQTTCYANGLRKILAQLVSRCKDIIVPGTLQPQQPAVASEREPTSAAPVPARQLLR